MKSKSKQNSGFLGAVERIGAKFPHPVVLFLWLTLIVFVLSFVCSIAGVTAIHPSTGDVIEPVNLISKYGFRVFLKEFVENFQAFPVLGVVVVMGAITGLCEKTGLLTTFIRVSVSKLNGTMVVLLFAFISVFSKMAGDVCQIIMPIIGAAMFYELGRHPLAGAFCGYAASSAGFAATIIPGSGEVTLTPVVISAAKLLMPESDLTAIGASYGLLVNAIVITVVTTIITIKVVEPRLGKYEGTPEDLDSAASSAVTDVERKALKKAGLALLIYLAVLVVLCIPQGSIFRND